MFLYSEIIQEGEAVSLKKYAVDSQKNSNFNVIPHNSPIGGINLTAIRQWENFFSGCRKFYSKPYSKFFFGISHSQALRLTFFKKICLCTRGICCHLPE